MSEQRRRAEGDDTPHALAAANRELRQRLDRLERFISGRLGDVPSRSHDHDADYAGTGHDHDARAARIYLGSAQSIPDSTWAQVEVDTVTDDSDGLFDPGNNRIEVDRAGWWLVSVGVGFDGDSGGNRRFAAIAVNGSRIARIALPPPAADVAGVAVADVALVASGDIIEAQAWQDSGGSLGLRAQEQETWLSAAYLGAG